VGYDTRMLQALELMPLAAFFIAYKLGGIYWATGILMASCLALVIVHRLITGKFKDMQVITALLVVLLGTATLLLHDKRFIQWKPTVLFGLLAIAFAFSSLMGKRPLVQRLFQGAMGLQVNLDVRTWARLNWLWAVWFAILAIANIYIAQAFSENVWVHFHVYGITAASIVFMLPQAIWLGSKSEQGAS
jgi:intracellular septation protein